MCRVETCTGDPVSGTIVCKTILYTRNRGSTSRIRISTLHILFTTYQRMYRVIRVTSFRRSIHYLVPSIKLASNSTWLLKAPPQLILFLHLGFVYSCLTGSHCTETHLFSPICGNTCHITRAYAIRPY